MKILVVGGAGYIGSHMVLHLLEKDHEVIVLDDLSYGHRDNVAQAAHFIKGSIADQALLDRLFQQHQIDAVMHFAAFIQVGESVSHPDKYYRNNVVNTLTLLDAMRRGGVMYFIFSSTAAVYGNPEYTPIDLQHPKLPINPYGRSKWMVEQILQDYDQAYGLKSICLRYFNAAGFDAKGRLGEHDDPKTHLIPLDMRAASGRCQDIKVFGRDYDTPDGTCVRDYIHVTDLCEAHVLALDSLCRENTSDQFNLGNGQGFSVQEVIDVARQVTGKPISVTDAPRRAGDPAYLIADASKARQILGWQPQFTSLESIIKTSWAAERAYTRL